MTAIPVMCAALAGEMFAETSTKSAYEAIIEKKGDSIPPMSGIKYMTS